MSGKARQWFDFGYEAFVQTFPQIAQKVGYRPFYVCPLCLRAFPEECLKDGWLSREDVPPKALGGRKVVLTCRPCNNRAGHDVDCHARLEADLHAFLGRETAEMKATLRTSTGCVPIQLKVSEAGIHVICVPKAARKGDSDSVQQDFGKAAQPDGWQDFKFKIEFAAFSESKARTSWLRSAYLAWFATLGYRFVYRRELDVVRERIKNPESPEPKTFRILQPKPVAEPTLVCIEEPSPFGSYAMLFGRNVIFLPRYGDVELYARLAAHPDSNVDFNGTAYPWPDRPHFFHDLLART